MVFRATRGEEYPDGRWNFADVIHPGGPSNFDGMQDAPPPGTDVERMGMEMDKTNSKKMEIDGSTGNKALGSLGRAASKIGVGVVLTGGQKQL